MAMNALKLHLIEEEEEADYENGSQNEHTVKTCHT